MKKEFLNYSQMNGYYSEIVRSMSRVQYSPDVILAPMRGGADIGVKLSHYFGVPLIAVEWQTRDGAVSDTAKLRQILREYNNSSILIVDDICDTGDTIKSMEVVIDRHCDVETFIGTVDTAVALFKESSDTDVTFHGRTLYGDEDHTWFVFPWEEWWK